MRQLIQLSFMIYETQMLKKNPILQDIILLIH